MLTWHKTMEGALAAAAKRKKPILSLRLLGRLDQELSCANSRFFKKWLYPDRRVAKLLEDRFVLHWQSVRPVPIITVDFGDGRKLVTTITGNSVHLVLDQRGRPIDALPGLFTADAFVRLASAAADLAETLPDAARLAGWHRARLARLADVPENMLPRGFHVPHMKPSAREAGALAMTKMMVERPLINAVMLPVVEEDSRQNEFVLHRQIHQHFASGAVETADELAAWIYEEVFLMPADDPWLGLRQGDEL